MSFPLYVSDKLVPAGVGRGKPGSKDIASVLQERLSVNDDGSVGMFFCTLQILQMFFFLNYSRC